MYSGIAPNCDTACSVYRSFRGEELTRRVESAPERGPARPRGRRLGRHHCPPTPAPRLAHVDLVGEVVPRRRIGKPIDE